MIAHPYKIPRCAKKWRDQRAVEYRRRLGGLLAGYLTTVTTEKTCQALVHKAFEPKSHRVDAASQLPTYRPLRPRLPA